MQISINYKNLQNTLNNVVKAELILHRLVQTMILTCQKLAANAITIIKKGLEQGIVKRAMTPGSQNRKFKGYN